MEAWIARWGLLAVLVGSTTEGDVTAVAAGFASHLGLLSFPAVVAMLFAGGLASDLFLYLVGRSRSHDFRDTRLYRRAGPALERWADRFGPNQILSARFLYGTRAATMVFWGIRHLPAQRFVPRAVLGAAAWAASFAGFGYVLSDSAEKMLGQVRRIELWLLAGVVLGVVLVLVLRRPVRRRLGGDDRGRGGPP